MADPNVRFGSKADMCGATRNVRFVPEADHDRRYNAMNCLYGEPVTLIALRAAAIYASSGLFARGSWHAFHFISPVCGHNVEYSDHCSGYGSGQRFGRRS